MGDEWINRIISLDPVVSLDYEDLFLIKQIRERVKSKENYVVFGGRPNAAKGLAEALIVFKQISKRSTYTLSKHPTNQRHSSPCIYKSC
jgi:predicted PilT family ATPase